MTAILAIFACNLCQLVPFIPCPKELPVKEISLPPEFGHTTGGGTLKMVVRKQEEYQQLIKNSEWGWKNTEYPKINFSEHSLLGQNLQASGCSVDYDVRVIRRANGNYTYQIKIIQYGHCELGFFKQVWIKTPKIPEKNEVSFVKEYKRRNQR
ncbi:MAG: hypothetical protein GVY04_04895 [Cyanobacteria bacterium]|jgi:hypothetical protein|nr:hypothetical protein [Cyanobacteria bacterium GSL.Bin1]